MNGQATMADSISASFARPNSNFISVPPSTMEVILTVLAWLFSIGVWVSLLFSVIGLIYVVIIGAFFLVGHIIFISHVRGNSLRLGPKQFPELYQVVVDFSTRMQMPVPEVYLMQHGGMLNALATKFLRSNMIVLFSDLIEACGDNTQARDMIIAHELGHLRAGHLKWHWFLIPAYIFPFLGSTLSRAREYTCDRYGMVATNYDPKALRGLSILAGGAKYGVKADLNVMAEQVHNLNTGWMKIGEWLSTHPPLAKRVIALDQNLKPTQDYEQKGVLRGLGILGLGSAALVFLIVGLVTALAVISASANKAQQETMIYDSYEDTSIQ